MRIITNKRIVSTTCFRAEGEKEYDDDSDDCAMERINTIRAALFKGFSFQFRSFYIVFGTSKLYFTRFLIKVKQKNVPCLLMFHDVCFDIVCCRKQKSSKYFTKQCFHLFLINVNETHLTSFGNRFFSCCFERCFREICIISSYFGCTPKNQLPV